MKYKLPQVTYHIILWIGSIIFMVTFIYVFREIIMPFAIGATLAYLLDPIVDWLVDKKVRRIIATSIILGVFSIILIASLIIIVPALIEQAVGFINNIPEYTKNIANFIKKVIPDDWAKFATNYDLSAYSSQLGTKATELTTRIISSILTSSVALFNFISLLFITPVVAFYMLNDWDRMIEIIDDYIPRKHLTNVRKIASDINLVIAGFIRGQGLVCLILGIFYSLSLTLIGLNYGLLIGFTAGLISFIPYVGSISGFLLAVCVALLQFWPEWFQLAMISGIFAFGQFIEGNFLSPKLVGNRVGLHPVWIMFSLLAFGYLFGFIGLLVAVPFAAAIGVIVRFSLNNYKNSSLYNEEK